MEKEVSIFDMIFDEDNNENIVLYNEEKKPVDFEQIAYIPLDEKDFVILKPVEVFDGMAEDEALVFEMVEDEDGESFNLVIDEAIIDEVFAEYDRLFEESSNN